MDSSGLLVAVVTGYLLVAIFKPQFSEQPPTPIYLSQSPALHQLQSTGFYYNINNSMNTITNNVHIIARIRPLLNDEVEKDIVVRTEGTAITIPNPKNQRENFTFPFNAVHDMESDQKQLFAEGETTTEVL